MMGKFKTDIRPTDINRKKGADSNGKWEGLIKPTIIDTERFIKIYPVGIDWFGFSKNTGRLLMYIWMELMKPDQDHFFINHKDAAKVLGKKDPKIIFDSLKELCAKGVIARKSSTNSYYININYMFNGSRVKFLKGLKKSY